MDGRGRVEAVKGATLSVGRGEVVGIVGPSGSGKSTLLALMGALRVPSGGEVFFEEGRLGGRTPAELRALRLRKIGFVFQQLRLIPTLSALENVSLPLALLGVPGDRQVAKAGDLLESVGLGGKEHRRPSRLSVGEQQRVSVARALANDPVLVLADEPTCQLDTSSGLMVIELLRSLSRRLDAAVVVSTHDQKVGEALEHVYSMRDGALSG